MREHELAVRVLVIGSDMHIWTADGKHHKAPLSSFRPCGTPGTKTEVKPDFSNIQIIDDGNTIKLGVYESAVDAALEDSTEVTS